MVGVWLGSAQDRRDTGSGSNPAEMKPSRPSAPQLEQTDIRLGH
jgi:hypothetical protein